MIDPEEIKTAESIGKRMARKWKGIEAEDVISHLYLWLGENQKYLDTWRQEERGQGKLVVSLRREAAKYCSKEQEQRIGKSVKNQPRYALDVVERALPYIWEYDIRASLLLREDAPASAILMDILTAFYELRKEEQDVLTVRYRDCLPFKAMGAHYDIGEDAARKRVNRALDRLQDRMANDTLQWVPEIKENKGIHSVLEADTYDP